MDLSNKWGRKWKERGVSNLKSMSRAASLVWDVMVTSALVRKHLPECNWMSWKGVRVKEGQSGEGSRGGGTVPWPMGKPCSSYLLTPSLRQPVITISYQFGIGSNVNSSFPNLMHITHWLFYALFWRQAKTICGGSLLLHQGIYSNRDVCGPIVLQFQLQMLTLQILKCS